jgi:hypothetical protein
MRKYIGKIMTTFTRTIHPYDFVGELFNKIDNGTIDEVLELAKEYDINQTNVRNPSRVYDTIERIKKRLTKENIDWTTL